jgi:lysozyme family protein
MADFNVAYQIVLSHEGGYVIDPDDPGGETYRGVARKIWSKWEGWDIVDMLKTQTGFPNNLDRHADLQEMIKTFYQNNFWDKVKGDDIKEQEVANSIFDFGVNAGIRTSSALAQMVVGAKTDGVIGVNTLKALNAFNSEHFLASFTVAKIARYVSIIKKRPSSRKFLYGWIRRAIGDI